MKPFYVERKFAPMMIHLQTEQDRNNMKRLLEAVMERGKFQMGGPTEIQFFAEQLYKDLS